MKVRPGNHTTARTILFLFAALALMLGSCTPSPAAPAAQGTTAPVEIRIAILPIIDALPMYVAQEQGYFTAGGVSVNFIPAASAAERDQLIAAGQADGMINDLVSVALYNKEAVQVQAVRYARTASSDSAMYRVMASKDSGLETAADLAGVPIGISQGTVIDYVTTRLLEKEGLTSDQIESVAVPKMNERMALLDSGELKAATLPEPFGTMAQQGGASIIVDDSKYPQYGYSVISFRKAFIDQNPQAVTAFLKAVEQAVADINKDPEAWRPLLGEYKLVPEPLQPTYPIPVFPAASIPSQEQFQDVTAWAKERQMIAADLEYSESVTDQYLP
jgi:NitT/TauT family transport system substrate-binding protein